MGLLDRLKGLFRRDDGFIPGMVDHFAFPGTPVDPADDPVPYSSFDGIDIDVDVPNPFEETQKQKQP